MKRLFSLLFLLTAIVACSDSDEQPQTLVLDKGTSTSQSIYADETTSDRGISFYAAEPWKATIADITRAQAEWIRLSQYSGGAGSFTLTLTIDPNTTGKDRKAEIRIESGASVITITIEQKGITREEEEEQQKPEPQPQPEPEKPTYTHFISRITSPYWVWEFSYDDKGRMIQWDETNIEDGKINDHVTYLYDGKVTTGEECVIAQKKYKDEYYEGYDTELILLDTSGKAFATQYDWGEISHSAPNAEWAKGRSCYNLAYNAANQLVKSSYDTKRSLNDDGYSGYDYAVEWTGDNLTSVSSIEPEDGTTEVTTLQYAGIANNSNLDLAQLIVFRAIGPEDLSFYRGEIEFLRVLDYFGARTKNMPIRINGKDDKGMYTTWNIEYKVNGDNLITEIRCMTDNRQDEVFTIEYK